MDQLQNYGTFPINLTTLMNLITHIQLYINDW